MHSQLRQVTSRQCDLLPNYVVHFLLLLLIPLLLSLQERLQSIVMSVSVCLSVYEDISRTKRVISTKFLCMLTMAMAQSSRKNPKENGAILGVFFPTDNAL